jgi:hypothetical protein
MAGALFGVRDFSPAFDGGIYSAAAGAIYAAAAGGMRAAGK